MKKSISLVFALCLLTSLHQIFGQEWINKQESENYIQRHECSFVKSGNKFIMFGGREQAKRLDIYDYSTNSWSQGAMAPIKFNHFQALEYDGLVWVVGAFKTNNFPNELPADAIYIYNPALNIWMEGPKIPTNRKRGGAGVVIYNEKIYLVAGNTKGHNGGFIPWLDVYDPLHNEWQQLVDAPRSRDHFSATIIDAKIYAVSGRLSGGAGGTFAPLIPEVDVYDLKENRWSTLSTSKNLPTLRAGASVVAFEDELFVIGGEGANAGPAFKKVEAYNPLTSSWSVKSNLNFARHGTQAIVSGQGIYIAGGSPVQGGGRQHNMEVYKNDIPSGKLIIASTLNAVKKVIFYPNETKNINITSSGGNAGNFITDIAIIGKSPSSFSIQKTLLKHLIKSGTSQNLVMIVDASATTETASLVITYDNKKIVTIQLAINPIKLKNE